LVGNVRKRSTISNWSELVGARRAVPLNLIDHLLLLFGRLTGLFRFLAPVIFRKGTYLAAVNWDMPVKDDQRQA
jgi:hypothetical protein